MPWRKDEVRARDPLGLPSDFGHQSFILAAETV
jgi:hypothetical protein